jgi:contactin associated protein-like 2
MFYNNDSRIERFDHGRQLMMVVDNYEPKIFNFKESLKASADAQFNSIQYLYIGKNESMREGFVGCISRYRCYKNNSRVNYYGNFNPTI